MNSIECNAFFHSIVLALSWYMCKRICSAFSFIFSSSLFLLVFLLYVVGNGIWFVFVSIGFHEAVQKGHIVDVNHFQYNTSKFCRFCSYHFAMVFLFNFSFPFLFLFVGVMFFLFCVLVTRSPASLSFSLPLYLCHYYYFTLKLVHLCCIDNDQVNENKKTTWYNNKSGKKKMTRGLEKENKKKKRWNEAEWNSLFFPLRIITICSLRNVWRCMNTW